MEGACKCYVTVIVCILLPNMAPGLQLPQAQKGVKGAIPCIKGEEDKLKYLCKTGPFSKGTFIQHNNTWQKLRG